MRHWLVRFQCAIGLVAIGIGVVVGIGIAHIAPHAPLDDFMQSATVERTAAEDDKRRACEAHKGREYVQATPASVGFCAVRP